MSQLPPEFTNLFQEIFSATKLAKADKHLTETEQQILTRVNSMLYIVISTNRTLLSDQEISTINTLLAIRKQLTCLSSTN